MVFIHAAVGKNDNINSFGNGVGGLFKNIFQRLFQTLGAFIDFKKRRDGDRFKLSFGNVAEFGDFIMSRIGVGIFNVVATFRNRF